ncbi:MAG: DUF371 domain-containing protein [Candidatus Bathyarchaeia archaeon]
MRVVEEVEAWGHENVTAKNRTTLEITREGWLTRRGDCVVAVRASRGATDLSDEFKQLARKANARVTFTIEAGELVDVAAGWGHPDLTLDHPTDIVVRKSSYICGRTLMIKSNKAARDLPRRLVRALKNPTQRVRVTIVAEA